MHVRTFRARSLEEALGLVRQELGPDAQVLQARELDTSWWERFSRGRHYEIRTREQSAGPLPLRKSGSSEWELGDETTSLDRPSLEATSRQGGLNPGEGDERWAMDVSELARPGLAWPDRIEPSAGPYGSDSPLDERQRRFQDFATPEDFSRGASRSRDPFELGVPVTPASSASGMPTVCASTPGTRRPPVAYSPRLLEVISRLIEADVTPHAARDLVDAVRDAQADTSGWTLDDWQRALVDQLRAELPRGGELRVTRGRCKVVAVVGPTGAGKTTTVAKLAARWRLEEHLKVALISVDTYRVAAVEQMRTYADIMGLPLEVVATPKEMHAAIARFADHDVVLVDTAGRSPHESLQLQELRALLAETQAEDTLLVLNGPSSASHHRLAVHRFLDVGVTGLVVTKLDEATSLGSLLPVVRETRLPVHYLTCGQSVPEDLTPADLSRLIPALLGIEPTDHVA